MSSRSLSASPASAHTGDRRAFARPPQVDRLWTARQADAITLVGAPCDQSPIATWWPTVLQRMHAARRPVDGPRTLAPARTPAPAADRLAPLEACLP